MNSDDFDTFTRTATRRRSLLALGGFGLSAALFGAFGAAAKKAKSGKRTKKKANARCKAQVAPCDLAFNLSCGEAPDPAACRESVLPCCDFLGSCNVGGFLTCLANSDA